MLGRVAGVVAAGFSMTGTVAGGAVTVGTWPATVVVAGLSQSLSFLSFFESRPSSRPSPKSNQGQNGAARATDAKDAMDNMWEKRILGVGGSQVARESDAIVEIQTQQSRWAVDLLVLLWVWICKIEL